MEIGHHTVPELATDCAFIGVSVRIKCNEKPTRRQQLLALPTVDTITRAPVGWRIFTPYGDSRSALIWLLLVDRSATAHWSVARSSQLELHSERRCRAACSYVFSDYHSIPAHTCCINYLGSVSSVRTPDKTGIPAAPSTKKSLLVQV